MTVDGHTSPPFTATTIPMYAAQQERPEERVLHVLDLPPIYTRPSALTLLSTLDRLKIKPFSWDVGQDQASTEGEVGRVRVDEDGVPKYLTGIISSSLLWIEDEDDRERVYESASARLAERAGRTAQPTLTRTFTIPGDPPDAPQIHICLREPSLTSDNLGHKTWLASYLLARRLPSLKHLLPSISRSSSTDPPRVLELGSGTGLLGIAAAALYPEASVHLTDLEAIVSNLEANVKANEALFSKGKSPSAGVLDWSEPSTAKTNGRFDLILASDPLYSPLHPTWLVVTILKNLNEQTTSRVIIELPLREAYVPEVEELKKRLADRRLVLLDSGEELGTEDWGDDAAHGRDKVRCWWGVWGWPWA